MEMMELGVLALRWIVSLKGTALLNGAIAGFLLIFFKRVLESQQVSRIYWLYSLRGGLEGGLVGGAIFGLAAYIVHKVF